MHPIFWNVVDKLKNGLLPVIIDSTRCWAIRIAEKTWAKEMEIGCVMIACNRGRQHSKVTWSQLWKRIWTIIPTRMFVWVYVWFQALLLQIPIIGQRICVLLSPNGEEKQHVLSIQFKNITHIPINNLVCTQKFNHFSIHYAKFVSIFLILCDSIWLIKKTPNCMNSIQAVTWLNLANPNGEKLVF